MQFKDVSKIMRGTDLNTFLEKHIDLFLADIWKKYNSKNPITAADKEIVLKSFTATVTLIFKAASNNKELITRIYKQLAIKFHPDKLDSEKSEKMVLFVKLLDGSKAAFQIIQKAFVEFSEKNKKSFQSAANTGGATSYNPDLNEWNIENFFFYNFNRVMSDISAIAHNDHDIKSSLIEMYLNLQIILCPEIFLLQMLTIAVGAAAYGTEKLLLTDQNHHVSTQLFYVSGLPSVLFANMLNITIKGAYNAVTNTPQLVSSTTQLLGENVGYITNRMADAVSVLNFYGYFSGSETNRSSDSKPVLLIEDNKKKQEQDQVLQILNKAEELLSAVIYEESTRLRENFKIKSSTFCSNIRIPCLCYNYTQNNQ